MKLFFAFFIFFSFQVVADTVRLTSTTDFAVSAITNATYSLFTDNPSGDATADTAPARVYIPIANTANGNDDYYYQSIPGSFKNTINLSSSSHLLRLPLRVSATQGQYIYMAAKPASVSGQTGYKIIQRYPTTISTTSDINFDVSPKSICDQFPNECTLLLISSTSMSETSFKTYYFLSTDGTMTLGGAGEPGTYTGGIYVDMAMSNRVYPSSSLIVNITETRKGDKRVFLTYTSTVTMLNFKKVLVYQHDAATPPATPPGIVNQPVASYPTGAFINKDFSTSQSGEVTVNELTNGLEYIFSVAFVDKYGFATTLSDDVSGQPIKIEELLKKQACYILTAGFGEEHYVTNYFRQYRDQVLSHSWFGKKLIRLYYDTAPKAALFIYQSYTARFVVRGFAYTIYFLFNYGFWLLLFAGSFHFLNIFRKNKLILWKNRL